MKLASSLRNHLRRAAALALSGAMLSCLLATGAAAADMENGGTPSHPGTTVQFEKVLNMENATGAGVPNTTFTYSIKPGTAVPAGGGSPAILAGVGNPVVGSAAFTAVDGGTTKKVDVDFSGVAFPTPGIYRYIITEAKSANPDIKNDENPDRYLDVYVINGNTPGSLVITDYVLLTKPVSPDCNGNYGNCKSTGYENCFSTYCLSLCKEVTGKMADLSKKFDFTIDFEGPANTTFTYNGTTVAFGADGKASVTGILLNNSTDPAVICGLPSTVKYTVTENLNANEGYTTTHSINGGAAVSGTVTDQTIIGKQNNSVQFTNCKEAVTPTGLATDIAPYLAMLLLAGSAALLLRRRKRSER